MRPSRRALRPEPPPLAEAEPRQRGSLPGESPAVPEAADPEAADPEAAAPETVDPEMVDGVEVDGEGKAECSHPAEARDYQSGTCAACGAILWD
ncbi:MAG TPA: hypothetical protein VFQ68_00935 [Streptosporangiaceae bacterium]|nr:hypothetical protein [Streptosporangiaceae bacterium]